MIAAKAFAETETAPRVVVEKTWRKKLPSVPLPTLNLRTLRKALAFELQKKTAAGLSAQAQRVLQVHQPKLSVNQSGWSQSKGSPPALVQGEVLVREWNGRRYQVTVGQGSYEMDGREYKSLTQIAKTITGTHWSGARFFGLVKATPKKT